jgi:hypothetical protein
MVDVDTFLTALYVIVVDDLRQPHRTERGRPGPDPSLCCSEVIALSIFARWSRFASERGFYRYAEAHLRGAFPNLPNRSQFNRLVRSHADDIEKIAVKLGQTIEASEPPYQALDSSAMPVRDAKRRGHGWLAGHADIGRSNSIGWYEGFSLLSAVGPSGVITGFCFGSASTADQPLAETSFAARATPDPRLLGVGSAFSGAYYVADKGFEGAQNHRRWLECYGAQVVHPPKRNSKKRSWSKRLRRWLAGIRQIVETVSTTSSSTPSACGESGPTTPRVCALGWRRGWLCTTSASGSTTISVGLG